MNKPHSVKFVDGYYFGADSTNHRIIKFDDLANPTAVSYLYFNDNENPPEQICRPHDLVYNPDDGYIYTVNGVWSAECTSAQSNKTFLYRFRPDFSDVEGLDLSSVLYYPRALTVVNGKIFIANSSSGSTASNHVVEINDFSTSDYTVHTTPDLNNDIEYHNGWWYSVYYSKLKRWKTWADAATGKYEDVYPLLDAQFGDLPAKLYTLTSKNNSLYVVGFKGDRVYRIFTE